jgi:cyclase
MIKIRGGEDYPIYFGAKAGLFKLAGEQRTNMIPAERLLWKQLRNRKILGLKFRRQHPCNEIILDFYCHEARLSIEVDGLIHEDDYQRERDIERTFILNKYGIKELRFSNWEVENQIEKVLDKIAEYLEQSQHPSPSRGRAGYSGLPKPFNIAVLTGITGGSKVVSL